MKKICSFFAILLVTFMSGCRPDQVGNTEFCQSGRNILTLPATNSPLIDTDVRNMILGLNPPQGGPGSWYGGIAKLRTRKLVIIPFLYSNVLPNTMVTTTTIRDAFFRAGTGSARDYFHVNSWGNFNLIEGVIADGWVQLQNPQSYYAGFGAGDPTLTPHLYADVCDKSHIDWSVIDTNNDLNISPDEAIICLLSPEGGTGMTARVMTISFNNDGGGLYSASGFMNVLLCKTQATQTGTDDIFYGMPTICHELCHSLFDLPDRYFWGCSTGWTGRWDIMSNACVFVNMNIVDKIKLGWLSPPIITDGSSEVCYDFPSSNGNPACLVIWDIQVPSQYFVVENRHREASAFDFDEGIGQNGLAIWCVNENEPDRRIRVSLVDARTAITGITASPNYGIGNAHYTGGEEYVLFSNPSSSTNNIFDCMPGDQCPITFIRYAGTAIEQSHLIHGIRAVKGPALNMYAAIY